MIEIGSAKYNTVHDVGLYWDTQAKGLNQIMAKPLSGTGYFPVSERSYEKLSDAVKDIPDEFFTSWIIFAEYR